ncbi:G2/M phase-specific E3 ubiquitin-protein ligase-like [Oreochromis aureus]|nr:G2/M phase-specific E3 ubiquitin-protein ligase-like [Oreochromis aureus]
MKDFNKDLKDGPFLLLYPDGTEVITVPGTQRPFTLEAYKAEVGKPYQRINVFICLKSDFEDVGENSDLSDSDPEIVIKRPSEFDLADTLPWELQHESSPLQKAAEYEKGAGDLVLANEVQQVLKAESEESLHNLILQNSTIFQTAGCLRNVKPFEKQAFVEEYLRWYILERNQSVIQRFKDGLESLNFLSALQQNSSVLAPLLCFSAKALTASELESMFRPDLSPAGSNKRHKEVLTLGFWADYLLDCEEKATAVCLEDSMMFATGLTAVPPAGMTPPPRIQFLSVSPFPVSNTCANTLKLPICDSYSIFKANMDFGIQNAPGFGCS